MRNKVFPERVLFFCLFLLFSCLYFYRIFTEGAVIAPGDAYTQNYPLMSYYASLLKGLIPPLWNPHEGAGVPFLGELQAGVLYPPNALMYFLLPVPLAYNLNFLLVHSLTGFFTFLYLREAGLGRLPAFLGGVVFAYSGFIASHTSHTSMLNASMWLPLIALMIERIRKTLDIRYALGLALAVSFQFLAGHTQICLYTYMVAGALVLSALPALAREHRGRFFLLCAAGGLAGLILASPQLVSTMRLNRLSWRSTVMADLGYIFFREFHVYLRGLPGLIMPHLYTGGYGAGTIPMPGDKMVAFVGSLPLVLAVVAALRGLRDNPFVRLWAAIAALGFILALGDSTPLGRLSFQVPVYNLFRAHGRNLLEFSFAISVLFAYGLNMMINSGRNIRPVLIALAGMIAFAAGFALISGHVPALGAAIGLTHPAVLVPIAIMAAFIALVAAIRRHPRAIYLIAALVALEAYSFGGSMEAGAYKAGDIDAICQSGGYDTLKSLSGNAMFRLFSRPEEHSALHNLPCGVDVANPYAAFVIRDYADLLDLEPHGYVRYWDHLFVNNTILSMLNVRFLEMPKRGLPDIGGISARQRNISLEPILMDPSAWVLSAEGREQGNLRIISTEAGAGTYLISFKARPLKKGASLRFEAFADRQAGARFEVNPLEVYPGAIGEGEREYYRMFNATSPGALNLAFISLNFMPIEINDISVEKAAGYGPIPLAAKGPVYLPISESPRTVTLMNLNALPRAYSVSRVRGAGGFREVKRMLDLNEANPANEAIVYEDRGGDIIGADFAKGSVSIFQYEPHRIALHTEFPARGFVVLAEQYYPGWRAFVDGAETEIYETNGVLRGVVVPGGAHEVTFRFLPEGLLASLALSIVGAMAAAASILLLARRAGRRRIREADKPA